MDKIQVEIWHWTCNYLHNKEDRRFNIFSAKILRPKFLIKWNKWYKIKKKKIGYTTNTSLGIIDCGNQKSCCQRFIFNSRKKYYKYVVV